MYGHYGAYAAGQVPSVYTQAVGAGISYGASTDVLSAIQAASIRERTGATLRAADAWRRGGLDAAIARTQGYVSRLLANAQRAHSVGHTRHAKQLEAMAAIANAEVQRLGGLSQMRAEMNGEDYGAAAGATNIVTGVTGAILGVAVAAIFAKVTKRNINAKTLLTGAVVGGAAGALAPQYLPAQAVQIVQRYVPA